MIACIENKYYMEHPINNLEAFKAFAEEQLHHHFQEIDTCYYNRQLNTWNLEEHAYEKHRELYGKELEEKIGSFPFKDNPEVNQQLQQLKSHYLEQLCFENFNKV